MIVVMLSLEEMELYITIYAPNTFVSNKPKPFLYVLRRALYAALDTALEYALKYFFEELIHVD